MGKESGEPFRKYISVVYNRCEMFSKENLSVTAIVIDIDDGHSNDDTISNRSTNKKCIQEISDKYKWIKFFELSSLSLSNDHDEIQFDDSDDIDDSAMLNNFNKLKS